MICRQWKNRVKGRDWYDFLWFIQRKVPVNLLHLETRLRAFDVDIGTKPLSIAFLKTMLHEKVDQLDVELAKNDIVRFIRRPDSLAGWDQALFHTVVSQIQAQE